MRGLVKNGTQFVEFFNIGATALALLALATMLMAALLLVPPRLGAVELNPAPRTLNLPASLPRKFVREYSTNDTYEVPVWGLSTAAVNAKQRFYVALPCVPGNCDDLYVVFEGPAIFTPRNVTRNETTAEVEFFAADSGHYDVHLEVQRYLNVSGPTGTSTFGRIAGSPFPLTVLESAAGSVEALAPTLHIPKMACPDMGWRTGRWVACHEWETGCMRGGWVWVPHSCHFNTYSAAQLLEVQEPLWIVLAGTSVQRGTFFSFVDMILQDRAVNLTESSFWKCWGWMDFTYGNVRVSYLDFRVERMFLDHHTEVDPHYQLHGMMAVQNMFKNGRRGPDLFYMECFRAGFEVTMEQVVVVRSWFPATWAGRFLIQPQKPYYGARGEFGLEYKKPKLLLALEAYRASSPGYPLVEYVDEYHLATPFMHTGEFGFKAGFFYVHYHRKRLENDPACPQDSIHACSYVGDMAAQQLLHVALGGIRLRANSSRSPEAQQFAFCLECPTTYTPFKIQPQAIDMAKCFSHMPKDREGG